MSYPEEFLCVASNEFVLKKKKKNRDVLKTFRKILIPCGGIWDLNFSSLRAVVESAKNSDHIIIKVSNYS